MVKKYSGVRPKSNSSIEIDFYYRGVRCRETIKLKPTPLNLKYAYTRKAKIEVNIVHKTFDYAKEFPNSKKVKLFANKAGDVITVKECLYRWLEWLKTRKNKPIKASTLHNYRKIVENRLIPEFGHFTLTELELRHVQKWISTCNCTRKTLTNLVSPLKCALDDAIYHHDIEHNILHGWNPSDRDVKKESSYEVKPFTAVEQQLILSVLEGQTRNLFQLAFWTGLRTSEMVALNWDDIDMDNGYIHVTQALTQAAKHPEAPKTKAGKRKVKLLTPAIQALKSQKSFTRLKNKEVFQNPKTGTRWKGDQAIRKTVWIPALKQANVEYRNPYQTRHTYASMMLTTGENIQWLSKQMGHTKPSMTADRYARFLDDNDDDAGNAAIKLFKLPS